MSVNSEFLSTAWRVRRFLEEGGTSVAGRLAASAIAFLTLGLIACGGSPSTEQRSGSVPQASASPSVTPSVGAVNVDFTLTGAYPAHITQATLTPSAPDGSGLVCKMPNATIHTIFQSLVNNEAVSIQVIARDPVVGVNRGVIVLVPPSRFASPTPGAFGADSVTWSTFNGNVTLLPDGMSGSLQGELARGGGPVIEHIVGTWRCAN